MAKHFEYVVKEPDCGIKITKVNVYPFQNAKQSLYTKGIASIVLNDALVIQGLRIMEAPHGWFVAYPTDTLYKGEDLRNAVDPTNDDLRAYINAVVLNKFFEERG